jgi:hypothetical protein
LKNSDSKLIDWLGHIAGVAACGFGGWLHSELSRLDRDVAVLKYRVFGVTAAAAPEPSLLVPEHARGGRARLADPSIFSFLKPKESPDEKPRK